MSEVVLTRDELGLEPLYYSIHQGKLHHATKIETLFQAGAPCEINYDMIPAYLMYQYCMGMQTLFKSVIPDNERGGKRDKRIPYSRAIV